MGEKSDVQVDAVLESDVTRVEQSVAEYLRDPTEPRDDRSSLCSKRSTTRRIRVTRTKARS